MKVLLLTYFPIKADSYPKTLGVFDSLDVIERSIVISHSATKPRIEKVEVEGNQTYFKLSDGNKYLAQEYSVVSHADHL